MSEPAGNTIAAPAAAQTSAEGGNANAQSGGVILQPEIQAAINDGIKAAFGGKTPDEFRNSFFAAQRRNASVTQPAGEPAQKKSEADITIEARVKTLEARERQVEVDERERSILSALTSAGVPADRQDAALDHLERRFGSKIKYNRDTRQGEFSEFEGDTPKPVSAFVSEFLKQPKGQIFLPAPSTGGVPRGQGLRQAPARAYHEMPKEERLKMSSEQVLEQLRAEGLNLG